MKVKNHPGTTMQWVNGALPESLSFAVPVNPFPNPAELQHALEDLEFPEWVMIRLIKIDRTLALVLTATLLAGCGGDKKADKIAKDRNFTPEVVSAMNSCLSTSHTRRLLIKNGKKQFMFAKPPLEFCACQAPVMAKVLTEQGYDENDKVLAFFAPKPEKIEIDAAGVKEGVTPAVARATLESAVKPCANKAKEEITRRQAEAKKKKPA
jgi:hypothetical protein